MCLFSIIWCKYAHFFLPKCNVNVIFNCFWILFFSAFVWCVFSIFQSFYDKNKKLKIAKISSVNYCYVSAKMLPLIDGYEKEVVIHFIIFIYLFFYLFFSTNFSFISLIIPVIHLLYVSLANFPEARSGIHTPAPLGYWTAKPLPFFCTVVKFNSMYLC